MIPTSWGSRSLLDIAARRILWMYRLDTSTREEGGSHGRRATQGAGTGRARVAARDAASRLRAAQTAQHATGHVPCVLLRVAVPVPALTAGARAHRGGAAGSAPDRGWPIEDRLQAHS